MNSKDLSVLYKDRIFLITGMTTSFSRRVLLHGVQLFFFYLHITFITPNAAAMSTSGFKDFLKTVTLLYALFISTTVMLKRTACKEKGMGVDRIFKLILDKQVVRM